jgi:hypothetical protein
MSKCGVDESTLMGQPLLFEAIQRIDVDMVRQCVREHSMLSMKARTMNCRDHLNPLQYLIVSIAHERRTQILLRARQIYNLLASEEYASDYVGDYSVMHLAEAFGLQGVLGMPSDEHDSELIRRLRERYSARYAFDTVLRGSFNDAEKAVSPNDAWVLFAKKCEFERDTRVIATSMPDVVVPIKKRVRWLLKIIGLETVVEAIRPSSVG